jgi:hypothetical protein
MKYFVDQASIVRTIWSKGDTVLFVFAGAAAEFALNKAVDWLYFTGRLPADPLGRLFSTMMYARRIVFSPQEEANTTIDQIRSIHTAVEHNRGSKIPDWAYRDVLFMLIHYSQASFELLERKMTASEKEDLYEVFYRLGLRMGLKDLPTDYISWTKIRDEHMKADLVKTELTTDLFRQYRKHLGWMRYKILIEGQKLVVPERVKQLLNFGNVSWFTPLLVTYQWSRKIGLDWFLKSLFLPRKYMKEIKELDVVENEHKINGQ